MLCRTHVHDFLAFLLVQQMMIALSKEKQESVRSTLQRGYGHKETTRVLNMSMGSVPGEITSSYILHTRAFGTYLLGGLFTLQKIS